MNLLRLCQFFSLNDSESSSNMGGEFKVYKIETIDKEKYWN